MMKRKKLEFVPKSCRPFYEIHSGQIFPILFSTPFPCCIGSVIVLDMSKTSERKGGVARTQPVTVFLPVVDLQPTPRVSRRARHTRENDQTDAHAQQTDEPTLESNTFSETSTLVSLVHIDRN